MFTSRWKLERERRQNQSRTSTAGHEWAVRPADGYVRYRGQDILLGTGSGGNDLRRSVDFLAFAQTSEQL